jgi:hypothetical protein
MGQVEIKSLEELKSYTRELAGKKAEDDPVVRKLHVAKRITWAVLLAASFLAFYLMDKLGEALSMLK